LSDGEGSRGVDTDKREGENLSLSGGVLSDLERVGDETWEKDVLSSCSSIAVG
jgi:hypothetical protein